MVFNSRAKIRVKNKVPLPAFRMDAHPKQDLDAQMVSFVIVYILIPDTGVIVNCRYMIQEFVSCLFRSCLTSGTVFSIFMIV